MKIERRITSDAAHVAFEGRLDAAWSEPATLALEEAIRSGRPRIELDLSKVSFVSSVGIGVLLRAVTRFRAVGGSLAIVAASDAVREMLRVAKLEGILGAPAAPAARAAETPVAIGNGWTGELLSLSRATGTARHVASGYVAAMRETLALGHLALAESEAAAAGHFGEGLVAGGTIAVAPAEAPRPDCLASGDDGPNGSVVRCIARDAIVVEGPIAARGSFEWDGAKAVPASSLASALVSALDGPVAFVAIGECAGAFGAWARTSPDRWTKPVGAMSPLEMRQALRYAGEPMLQEETLCVVAVAARPADRVNPPADVLRTLSDAGGVLLHAHAAVAAYRPVPKSVTDVAAIGSLLAEQPLRAVMHALAGPAGEETSFVRGSFWAIRLGGAA